MGGKGEGRLPFMKKEVAGFKYKRCLAMQNFLRNGEAQIRMRLPQTHPCARNHPPRFEEHYKPARMAPVKFVPANAGTINFQIDFLKVRLLRRVGEHWQDF